MGSGAHLNLGVMLINCPFKPFGCPSTEYNLVDARDHVIFMDMEVIYHYLRWLVLELK